MRRATQVRIRGAVTVVHLEGAVLDPRTVAVPLTVVSDRGFGNGGELTDASGTRAATGHAVDLAAYDLTLTPAPGGGWSIEGLIDTSGVD